ncbi:MAG: TraR/DksA C4-type zinc finger protein [Bacteroidota bacterium]
MATKKQPVAKKGKAPVKPVAKKVVKPVAKKVVKSAPAKKAAPKKAAKPAPKPVKKPAAKTPVKKAAKPAPKPAPLKKVAAAAKSAPLKVAAKVASKPAPVVKKEEPKKTNSIKTSTDIKAKDIKVPAAKPVAIPKLTTTAARKYEPSFTKSVLDKAPIEAATHTMRYSDTELNEFRELIQRKLEAAKKELTYLQGLITRKDDMGGDEGDNRYMTMEDGSLSMEREQLSQMASRQITFIDHLEKALMRIENKTYGICRVTGKLIDKARLRAVPHATLSIEAKMGKVS